MRLFTAFIVICLSIVQVFAPALFDGSDDIIGFGVSGDTILEENAPTSVSCWFYALSDGETSSGMILRRGSLSFRFAATHAIQLGVSGGTAFVRKSANNAFSTNLWNHLVMTWDGSTNAANCHIYVNGAEVSYATTTNGQTPTDNSPDSVVIGSSVTGGNTFDGMMSNVSIYGGVINASDIYNLFHGKVSVVPLTISSLSLAYWPLDDFADGVTFTGSDTVKDRSTKERHGSPTNGPVARASTIVSYP